MTMMVSYRDGLLQVSEETRFTARVLTESLQDFVETLVGWMRHQYAFDPTAVELPFGEDLFPAWELDLGKDHKLLLHGRIDRIDICRDTDAADEAHCVVVDYKSSQKQLDPLLMEHGLQLQLAAYLNVLRHWPDPRPIFGVQRLIPSGVFYVNLRGRYDREQNRDLALADTVHARKLAYRHTGRFDSGVLPKLDQRRDTKEGDQFNYRLTKDGKIHGNSKEAMETHAFEMMLSDVDASLTKMGQAIYSGVARLDPYRKGSTTACEGCDYHSICRVDPWMHQFRVLRKSEDEV
jgi:ATP-dependent helicase/nuclease subunit B